MSSSAINSVSHCISRKKAEKAGKYTKKIRKKYEIVLKSVFFVVLGDFLGVWGCFGVFFRVFRGFLQKKSGLGQQKRPDGPPYLGGVRCFSGCKIFRALRARSPWRSWFVGDFWNPSALWWGQFDEMDKFLAFGQHQCKGQVILPTEQEKGETGSRAAAPQAEIFRYRPLF